MTEATETTEELEQELETNEEDKKSQEWDKHRQELDNERANARKAREELASVSELYESASERLENQEKELEQLKRSSEEEKIRLENQRKDEEDKLNEMDPDLVDPQVIKNIQVINNQIKKQRLESEKEKAELRRQIQELTNKAGQLEQERAEIQRKAEHDRAVESVLSEVEDTLKTLHNVTTPGQYRSEAIKRADELVDTGKRKKPNGILEGVKLMRECYLEVISAHQKKKGVSVDGGKSGVTSGVKKKPERKTGTLDEVASDMLKDKSWKED